MKTKQERSLNRHGNRVSDAQKSRNNWGRKNLRQVDVKIVMTI